MTAKRRIVVALGVVVLGLAAVTVCITVLRCDRYEQQIRELESGDIDREVREAVAKGDYRFVGVMGIGLIVPGVPDYQQQYSGKFGVRVIPNTSDAIESGPHLRLQQAAGEHATKYNAALLLNLPASDDR